MHKFVFMFGASLFLVGAAHAEGFYVGGSAGVGDAALSSNSEFDDPDDNLFIAKGIGGYRVNEFFAFESTIVGATNNEYDDGFDGQADVSFGAVTGSFLGIIPVDENFEFFAKVGGYVGESEVDDSFLFFGSDNDEDESGLLWGGGVFINFGSRKQFTIRVEYEQYDTDALDDFWAVNGGFQYNF
ncbi:MAG: hypothetical protein OEM85_17295 [Gammaproteobacteria bacterium]|nr:hypothetical protein [Gammaproteobacteria bacterium]MDH3408737.1 hypothetical protein [Gammaproteobacteria bacterium]